MSSISQAVEVARLRKLVDAHQRELRRLHDAINRINDELSNYQRKRGRKPNGQEQIEIQAQQ